MQSVIFPTPAWKGPEAAAWLRRNKLKATSMAQVRGSIRATLRDARDFTRLRTIETTGHPHPLKNPTRHPRPFLSDYTIAELTRDPREQGFRDAKASKASSPPPWYTPAERGHYAEGYIAGGQGRKGRPTPPARLKNPRVTQVRPTRKELDQAVRLYERFREARPRQVGTVRVQLPTMLVSIGPVPWLEYLTTHRNGKQILYRHTFAKHARPTLAATHDGRAIYLVGGEYDFTGDGIVDR